MFYVMFSGGETDAQLIINDFLTCYITVAKCLNVNQADYRSCLENMRSSFNNLPTMNLHRIFHIVNIHIPVVNILKQGVRTQLDTLLNFNIYTFH